MKVQSLSVCVPGGCKNNCKFCVSGMDDNTYEKRINFRRYENVREYKNKIEFARDNGCNILMLTGNNEPIENMDFIKSIGDLNRDLESPFRWIELQTSGVGLTDKKLETLKYNVGVSVISLSLSCIWDDKLNAEYNETPEGYWVNIKELCNKIKSYGFTLRLSLNMVDYYDDCNIEEVFYFANKYGVNQLTFRELYTSGKDLEKDKWIKDHKVKERVLEEYKWYIEENGEAIDILPYGFIKYSIEGLSVVIDSDCMNKELKDTFKYLILRPDCKLYTKWDRKESVLF